MGTLGLTTHEACKQTGAVDGDALGDTRAPRLRREPVVGAQDETRPAPDLDLDGFIVSREREEPFNPIAKGNDAREPKLLHGLKAARRAALGIAPAPRLSQLDQQRLEPDKVARFREMGEYRCRRCADPDTLLKAEPHGSGAYPGAHLREGACIVNPPHRLAFDRAVDADGHILEPPDLWERYLEPRWRDRALRIRIDGDGLEYLEIDGKPSRMSNRGFPGTLGRMGETRVDELRPTPERTYLSGAPFGSMDARERLQLLDAEHLDAAILYPTLGILWEAELEDVELSQAYCRAYNRWIADFCRDSGGRLVPIAHLSLGDPAAAARELERAVGDGCRGGFVVPFTIGRKAHGHPDHDAVFAAAQDLGVPLAIHPSFEPIAIVSRRFVETRKLRLLNSVIAGDGVRHAFTTLFDHGVFDRFPRLKIAVLESGAGWIGYWLDRLDAVYEATFIGGRVPLREKPSFYFQRQCWISCDPDERTIPALMNLVGADRFVWASDYPHPDHTGDYLKRLEELAARLAEPARERLLGANAREAYGLGV